MTLAAVRERGESFRMDWRMNAIGIATGCGESRTLSFPVIGSVLIPAMTGIPSLTMEEGWERSTARNSKSLYLAIQGAVVSAGPQKNTTSRLMNAESVAAVTTAASASTSVSVPAV